LSESVWCSTGGSQKAHKSAAACSQPAGMLVPSALLPRWLRLLCPSRVFWLGKLRNSNTSSPSSFLSFFCARLESFVIENCETWILLALLRSYHSSMPVWAFCLVLENCETEILRSPASLLSREADNNSFFTSHMCCLCAVFVQKVLQRSFHCRRLLASFYYYKCSPPLSTRFGHELINASLCSVAMRYPRCYQKASTELIVVWLDGRGKREERSVAAARELKAVAAVVHTARNCKTIIPKRSTENKITGMLWSNRIPKKELLLFNDCGGPALLGRTPRVSIVDAKKKVLLKMAAKHLKWPLHGNVEHIVAFYNTLTVHCVET